MSAPIDLSKCSTMDHDLQKYHNAAVEVAKKAGEMIREAWYTEKKIETKDGFADLVTETDQNVEKFIISSFKEKFPTHKFIGEESVAAGVKNELTDVPTWIIDPVDGTTNFVHRFPFSCVSIGLAVNKQIEVGVVYNPILDEMFTARKGHGSFCNGKKLQVTDTKDLEKSLVMGEFGSQRNPEILDAKLKTFRNLIMKVHGIRSVGSAAMAMAQVAAGRADSYSEFGVHVWDIAAGYLLVKEAGGVVVDPSGGEFDMMSRKVLCSGTAELAQKIVPLLENLEYERD